MWALENCWLSAHGTEVVPCQARAKHKFVMETRRNTGQGGMRLRGEESREEEGCE